MLSEFGGYNPAQTVLQDYILLEKKSRCENFAKNRGVYMAKA